MVGKAKTLKAHWAGNVPPRPGHFLVSVHRPRVAYEILEVKEANGSPTHPYRLRVSSFPLSDVPDGATIHGWKWDRPLRPRPRR
jgi:hypothetical protein